MTDVEDCVINKSLLTALAIILIASVASATVDAHVDFTPTHTLPGLPVNVTLRLANRGTEPVTLDPARCAIRVRSQSGLSLVHATCFTLVQPVGESHRIETLAPGESEIYTSFSGPAVQYGFTLVTNPFDGKPRASNERPGQYQAEFIVGIPGNVSDELLLTLTRDDLHGVLAVSNPATLVVDVPTGEDEQAWNFIREQDASTLGGAEWSLLADDVIARYPNSRYAQLLFANRLKHNAVKEAIARYPESPLILGWKITYAITLYYDVIDLASCHHVTEAFNLAAEGDRLITELLARSDIGKNDKDALIDARTRLYTDRATLERLSANSDTVRCSH